jgi:hypothetical protein
VKRPEKDRAPTMARGPNGEVCDSDQQFKRDEDQTISAGFPFLVRAQNSVSKALSTWSYSSLRCSSRTEEPDFT